MGPLLIIQAISAGICFYAGIVHLMIGLRSKPRNRVHLTFAFLSLIFGVLSVVLLLLVAAVDSGSLDYYIAVDKISLFLWYLSLAALFWFIAVYTDAKNRTIPLILTIIYTLIALSNFILPYTWVYTDIILGPTFPPDIVVAPWYSAEHIFTLLALIIYSAYYASRQYRRGEKEAARALAIAMGIFIFTVLWDYAIEYGLIDTVLMAQYGFLAFIIIMSLRLSGQAVEAEKEARRLNIELEDRVEERTIELSEAKESAEAAVTELQESESRLDYVLRSARLAIWEYDLQALETKVTDAFPYLLGYDPDDILVKSDEKWRGYELGHHSLAAQLLNEDDKERYAAALGEMIAGNETFEVEHRLRMADGQWNWMRDHGKIVHWDEEGKPLFAYGVVMDIDDMKRLQLELIAARDDAESANRAKSVFLANMSHELRTPLNAILGFSQLMERDPQTTPRQMEQLETINTSGEYLLDLINDILDMSRIEAGRADAEITSFDLIQSLGSLESILRVRAENKGLDLAFEIEAAVPRTICSDQSKLRQVLFNLLGNAIKFTEEGQVVLRVLKGETESGDSLHFEIEDTGVGIDGAEMDQLFEPFSQTQSGLRLGQGTGLGLPISRQYVQLLGGDISVDSKPGKGSTFAFDIDYEMGDIEELTPEKPARRVSGLADEQPTHRILIVEDSPENRRLLRQMLEGAGFEVRTANNGREGLAEYKAWGPHLIWMDIRMPVMDGYEATRLIKAGDGPETKIIAITASVFEEEREQVLAAGCDDFVRKPFKEAEIFDIMAEHLGVEYVYETAAIGTPAGDTVSLAAQDLAALPGDWTEKLRGAAMRGRSEELRDLIAQIAPQYPEVAGALETMVDDLAFTDIVALTEPAESHG